MVAGALVFGKNSHYVRGDEGARFSGIMWRAGHAHGSNRPIGETLDVACIGGTAKLSPFAPQRTPRTATTENVRVQLVKPAATVPGPQPEEGGGGDNLAKDEPHRLLGRKKTGGATWAAREAAKDRLLFRFGREALGTDERLNLRRREPRLNRDLQCRD